MSDDENMNGTGDAPSGEAAESDPAIIPLDERRKSKPKKPARAEALSADETKAIVEAILFSASGPVNPSKLAKMAGARDARALRKIIEQLRTEYSEQKRAFTVEEIAGGYQLMTLPEFHSWISKLREDEQEDSLSQAALETLAIITYRQPITRADIEDIRGVQSGYILRSLIEKGLVKVTGRSEQLGHPLLYGTTKQFLDVFSLASLDALPKLDELQPPDIDGDGDESEDEADDTVESKVEEATDDSGKTDTRNGIETGENGRTGNESETGDEE